MASAMTAIAIKRSDQRARLKNSHHTRMTADIAIAANMPASPTSTSKNWAPGATTGKTYLINTSRAAAVTPGQRRRGLSEAGTWVCVDI